MLKPSKKESQAAPKKPSKKEIKAEIARQQALAKNVLFPLLLKHSKSVKNAENICKSVVVGMDAVFMKEIKEHQAKRSEDLLGTLSLDEFLNNGPEFDGIRQIVEALKDEKINSACAVVLVVLGVLIGLSLNVPTFHYLNVYTALLDTLYIIVGMMITGGLYL